MSLFLPAQESATVWSCLSQPALTVHRGVRRLDKLHGDLVDRTRIGSNLLLPWTMSWYLSVLPEYCDIPFLLWAFIGWESC